MDDLISREYMKSLGATCIASRSKDGTLFPIVAIDELPPADPTHPTPSNTLGALDCVSREDLTKGIETYFGDLPIAVHYDMLALAQRLPSVQPEIIRCKYCKHWNNAPTSDGYNSCEKDALIRHESFFCADAKLRGDRKSVV